MRETDEHRICDRFRGFLPVVIDVETGGFMAATDALLEIAATTVRMDEDGLLAIHRTHDFHVQPFEGANLEQAALDFTGIDPYHPFRQAVTEEDALQISLGMQEDGSVISIERSEPCYFSKHVISI